MSPHAEKVALIRRWVCQVVRSGFYHNGAGCNPNKPHDDWWRCGYYFDASFPDPGDGSTFVVTRVPPNGSGGADA